MDDLRLGRLIRAVRHRLGWRQADVAARAGVSQQLVSVAEAGRLDDLAIGTLRSIAAALEIRLPFAPMWRGGGGDALLDAVHAAIVNAVVALLHCAGWICIVEYTFSHYGERGSIDILAWHPRFRALLVIEVKSRIFDVQALFVGLDRKARLAPTLVARDKGWQPLYVGRVVVLEESHANRSTVARHANAFSAALPTTSREVRRWLRQPVRPLAGLWFLTLTTGAGTKRKLRGAQRLRARNPRSR